MQVFKNSKITLFIFGIACISGVFIYFKNSFESPAQNKPIETELQSAAKNNSVAKNDISFCHFAKIVDKDGFVNIRAKANINSKIVGRIKSGETIYIFDDLGTDWLSMCYGEEKKICGYIHRSRFKYINTFEKIPLIQSDDSLAKLERGDISVEIKTGNFNHGANKKYLSKDKEGFDKYKGKFMWGTDGYSNEAKTYYKSITASVGKQTVKIPNEELTDLFNANNDYAECYYDSSDNSLYIHLTNSDGSGSYVGLFTVRNGVYRGRQIELPF